MTESYLTGRLDPSSAIMFIHPTILWIFLSLITIFMTVSRYALRNYLKNQVAFRSTITNPQVKNTITFKTLTYGIIFLGILSTLFTLSSQHQGLSIINGHSFQTCLHIGNLHFLTSMLRQPSQGEDYILIVLNLINIITNIFLLSYLFYNQEAIEFMKAKNREDLKEFTKFRKNKILPEHSTLQTGKVFTLRIPGPPKEIVDKRNDVHLVEMDSTSSTKVS